MKDIKVFDANGNCVFELTNNGEISFSDGYSAIVNGNGVVKDKDGDNENGGFFTGSNSFSWIMLLFMLFMFSGDANSKDIDLLADAFVELKESKKRAEEDAEAEANNAEG